jgi:hypothetical protein
MKLLSILVSILLLSCSNVSDSKAPVEKTDTAHDGFTAQTDPQDLKRDTIIEAVWFGAHLHYYYPSTAEKQDTLVVYLIFDPAAKGKAQIQAWKGLANDPDSYRDSVMFISVDDSRNGMKASDVVSKVNNIELMLAAMIKKPYALYATGLSGGARIAAALQGSNQFFKGLILCCAAPQPTDLQCPSILYSANEDMNFLECYEYYQSTSSNQLQLRIENGQHEWPTNAIFGEMIKDLAKPLTKQIVNTSKTDLSATSIKYEAQEQEVIQKAYFQQPITFWETYLAKKRSAKAAVEKRLLNYTSLYSYSVVNNPQVQNDPSAFDYALQIYEWADANNSEWIYLRSVYYLQQKDERQAFKYLEKAIKNGFSNTERLFANAYWKNYTNDKRFTSIIAK